MFKTASIVGTFLLALPRADATCLADNKLKLKSCGVQCSGSMDRVVCVSNCLQKQDVVASCADGLGSEFDCSSRFCANACEGGHRSGACDSCLHAQCTMCSTELDFQAHTPNMDDALAEAVEAAAPPADNDTAAVKMLAARAGSCASSGALISSCGTPCYLTTDPSGCYAKCAMKSCFSGCYDCSSKHCFESCRRSFSSYECATCVSGFCGGCTVRTGMQDSTILP